MKPYEARNIPAILKSLVEARLGRGIRKAVDGIVSGYSLRESKSGSWAHTYVLGRESYTHFSDDVLALMQVGDKVRFVAEKRTLRSGSRRAYLSIETESIEVVSPPELTGEDGGYVYVLVHPAMQGLRKIGFTRSSPEERAATLSGVTGVPGRFNVEWSIHVNGDPARVEKSAHALLGKHRFEKEFFRVSAETARDAIQCAYVTLYPTAMEEVDAVLQERVRDEARLREEARKRIDAARLEAEWKRSDEYTWTRNGVLRMPVLAEMNSVERPGLLQRMFNASFPENARVEIHGALLASGERWRLHVDGYVHQKDLRKYWDVASLDEALDALRALLGGRRLVRVSCVVDIPVGMLEPMTRPSKGQVARRTGGLVLETSAPDLFRLRNGGREVDGIGVELRAVLGRSENDRPAIVVEVPATSDPVPAKIVRNGATNQRRIGRYTPAEKTRLDDADALPKYPWGSKSNARQLLKVSGMSDQDIDVYLAQFAD